MPTALPHGILVVSIDLELDIERRVATEQRILGEVTAELIALFDCYQLAATWAVADPVVSAATESILAGNQPHEIAVLGDHTWVGSTAGRERFSKELTRRVNGARAVGLPLSTIVLRDAPLVENHDLLIKQGIRVLRGPVRGPSRRVFTTQPRAVRFGLWEVTASCVVPTVGRWRSGGGFAACRMLGRAAARPSFTHLVVDAQGIVDVGLGGLRVVQRVLRYAAQHRDRGVLAVETLAASATRLAPRRTRSPARSILSRQAA